MANLPGQQIYIDTSIACVEIDAVDLAERRCSPAALIVETLACPIALDLT